MKNSIYHTVDDIPIGRSVEQINRVVLSKPDLKWAALIDRAFDFENSKRPDLGSFIDCYDFPEFQGLNAVSPCLVLLSPGGDLLAQLARLIRHCQGRPMLSFVGTERSVKEISARWREVHKVSVVDEQEMLLRFADTRILAYLPKILTSMQWRAVCGAVTYWTYFDRSGQLAVCDIPISNDFPDKVALSKKQLDKLLEASHPDALIALIKESMCDIVPVGIPASERYRIIKDSCELGKTHEVKNNADVLALAVAAYLTGGDSNLDHRLESLLRQKLWTVGSLGDAIVDAEII